MGSHRTTHSTKILGDPPNNTSGLDYFIFRNKYIFSVIRLNGLKILIWYMQPFLRNSKNKNVGWKNPSPLHNNRVKRHKSLTNCFTQKYQKPFHFHSFWIHIKIVAHIPMGKAIYVRWVKIWIINLFKRWPYRTKSKKVKKADITKT